MKKFVLHLGWFTAVVFAFNLIVFQFSWNNYYREYYRFPDKKHTIFLFADSHGLPLGKTTEKYNVYNFSNGSDSYLDIKRKLSFLLENNYSVSKIFLSVDDHTLSKYRENSNNKDRSLIYSSIKDFSSEYEFLKERYVKFYFPIFQSKMASLFKAYLTSLITNPLNSSEKVKAELIWKDISPDKRIKNSKKRMLSQFPDLNKSDQLEKTLLEIMKLCKSNKIELVGIKFPLTNEYHELIKNKGYGADSLFLKHGFEVIDLRELYLGNPELFENQDHLNTKGGKLFSETLFNNPINR